MSSSSQASGQSQQSSAAGSFGSSPLEKIIYGLFGNAGAPYENAMKEFSKYFNQSTASQNPFYNSGTKAIGGYENWLDKMKDPSSFINNLMSGYQQSAHAKYLTDASNREFTNIGSAEGTTGSTPLMQQMQQNSGNIASGDMNSWLQNVLGINRQYGGGLQSLMGSGQHAADMLSQLFSGAGSYMGAGEYGKKSSEQGQEGVGLSGLFDILKFFAGSHPATSAK